MFNACVQKFDRMDEKFLNGELNKALSESSLNVEARKYVILTISLDSKFFCKIDTVALSFVLDKYCLIMD